MTFSRNIQKCRFAFLLIFRLSNGIPFQSWCVF